MLLIQAGTGTAIGIAVFFVDTTGSRAVQDIFSKFFALAYLPDSVLVPLIAISFLAAIVISVLAVALRARHFTRWSDRYLGSSATWCYVVRQTLIGVCVVSGTATIAWSITFWRLVGI